MNKNNINTPDNMVNQDNLNCISSTNLTEALDKLVKDNNDTVVILPSNTDNNTNNIFVLCRKKSFVVILELVFDSTDIFTGKIRLSCIDNSFYSFAIYEGVFPARVGIISDLVELFRIVGSASSDTEIPHVLKTLERKIHFYRLVEHKSYT